MFFFPLDLSAQHTSFNKAATQVIIVFRRSDIIGPFYIILTPFSINITYWGWVSRPSRCSYKMPTHASDSPLIKTSVIICFEKNFDVPPLSFIPGYPSGLTDNREREIALLCCSPSELSSASPLSQDFPRLGSCTQTTHHYILISAPSPCGFCKL